MVEGAARTPAPPPCRETRSAAIATPALSASADSGRARSPGTVNQRNEPPERGGIKRAPRGKILHRRHIPTAHRLRRRAGATPLNVEAAPFAAGAPFFWGEVAREPGGSAGRGPEKLGRGRSPPPNSPAPTAATRPGPAFGQAPAARP